MQVHFERHKHLCDNVSVTMDHSSACHGQSSRELPDHFQKLINVVVDSKEYKVVLNLIYQSINPDYPFWYITKFPGVCKKNVLLILIGILQNLLV